MELESLVQIFGGAGATFYIMWLWLKDVKKTNKELVKKLEQKEKARIDELKEMLPLLTEASKGLQDVLKGRTKNDNKTVEEIKKHLDKSVKRILEKCKKK